MNHAAIDSIIEKQKKRYQVLRWMYEVAGDNTLHRFPDTEVSQALGIDEPELTRIQDYLVEERLIKRITMGNSAITHWGIK